MAKVILKAKREIEAGYHIYRQPSPAGELTTIRRKLAMPSDVDHSSSKPTQRQRQRLSRASKRWAKIPALIRADLSNRYGFVPVQGHFAEDDYKVLKGRELFMAQEIHQQQYFDKHQDLPPYLCIILCGPGTDPLDGNLTLTAYPDDVPIPIPPIKLATANFLFYNYPPQMNMYIPYGSAPGYHDPGAIRLQDHQLPAYHHHHLQPGEPVVPPEPPPGSTKLHDYPSNDFSLKGAFRTRWQDLTLYDSKYLIAKETGYLCELFVDESEYYEGHTVIIELYSDWPLDHPPFQPPPEIPYTDYLNQPNFIASHTFPRITPPPLSFGTPYRLKISPLHITLGQKLGQQHIYLG